MANHHSSETGKNNSDQIEFVELAVTEAGSGEAKTKARRRLIRQGASIVAVSLASRPVLAWHCKPVSIVGSEALYANMNNSLTNAPRFQKTFVDETWGVNQWAGNVARPPQSGTQADEWWELNKPWKKLKAQTGITKKVAEITIGDLSGVTAPQGMSTTTPIINLLNMQTPISWQKRVLVAQLNYLALNGIPNSTNKTNFGYKNDMDQCITMGQLNEMASGTFYPRDFDHSLVWDGAKIADYLMANWMAVN